MSDSSASAPTRNPILWGGYLACSWTWCIGMFLPILLLRDMGWTGYWIFAVPNIVGAAVMGWVIKTRSDSAKFVEEHSGAIWWFSAITLAFHVFWILWIGSFIGSALNLPLYYFIGGIGVFLLFLWMLNRFTRRGKIPQAAAILFAFSMAVLVGTFFTTDLQEASAVFFASTRKSMDARWMLPVMLFGFLLCPFLDITFHHARQQLDSKKNGRLGFTIGFVGFFSFMIFLTTRYAGAFAGAMDGSQVARIATPWLATGILLHLLCQAFFSIHVHLNRMRTLPDARHKQPLLIVILVVAGCIGILAPVLPGYTGLSGGEIIYRFFMSAYGLVFPAYLLYRVIARKSRTPFMWIAMALALPFYWMGFIEGQTIWLVPGIGLLFVGAFIAKTYE
ncbi:hypothetical protein P4C99_12650 [Pontiellaceae bacterium B1224]|nr:hypothetical protein [Pontiellaceae bacterium B1224]